MPIVIRPQEDGRYKLTFPIWRQTEKAVLIGDDIWLPIGHIEVSEPLSNLRFSKPLGHGRRGPVQLIPICEILMPEWLYAKISNKLNS